MDRLRLIDIFTSMLQKENDDISITINNRRKKAILFLKNLNCKILSENEIDKVFNIDMGI